MANVTLNTTLLVRRGTATEWTSSSYILKLGEPGYDSDNKVLKIGDGTSTWSKLNPINKTVVADSDDGYILVDGQKIQVVDLSAINNKINAKYTKPTGGIPLSDLDPSIKTSLDNALVKADITSGTANGTIAVKGTNVAVKGLGSAAYTASTTYATAAQGTKADAALPKTDFESFKETNTAAIADAKKAGTDATSALNSYKTSNDAKVNKNTTDIAGLKDSIKTGISFKGKLDSKPAVDAYNNGDLIIVGNQEFILLDSKGTKTWEELGNEGDHLTKAIADGYYVLKNTPITAGTHCKISYDAKGLVTGGSGLSAADIPGLSADKITSGTFPDARIASAAKWNAKQNAITSDNKLPATNVSGLATVATSGSYNDLTNKPTIDNNNQKVSVGNTTFGANDTVNFIGSGKIAITGDAVEKTITISTTGLGTAAEKNVVTSVDTSANLPTSSAVKTYVDTAVSGKDVGVTKVSAGTDITVTPASGTGAVTVAHKSYTTTQPTADAANTGFITGLVVTNGHVTGAKSNTLAAALPLMTFTLDGGNASGN